MNVVARMLREWRGGPGAPCPETALGNLSTLVRSRTLRVERIGRSQGTAASSKGVLDALARADVDVVELGPTVYGSIPTRRARVDLLTRAASAANDRVVVHVPVEGAATHVGRAFIDGPRRVLRALGHRRTEPGDRFGPNGFTHHFFDEEALVEEVSRAGLGIVERRGFSFTLTKAACADASTTASGADPFLVELARVVRVVGPVEFARRKHPPARVVEDARARGSQVPPRSIVGRARLRRAIGWVDAWMPTGANCFRRTLLELALDGGAAKRTLVFGLDVGKTGHVAFADDEERVFDVVFEMAPPA